MLGAIEDSCICVVLHSQDVGDFARSSAAQFHIESFGAEAFDDDSDVEAAYVAEGNIAVT